VGLPLCQQLLGALVVARQPLALQERPLVPGGADPGEGGLDLPRHRLVGALLVGVLDAQHEGAAGALPQQVVVDGRAGAAHVQEAGGRGSEADPHEAVDGGGHRTENGITGVRTIRSRVPSEAPHHPGATLHRFRWTPGSVSPPGRPPRRIMLEFPRPGCVLLASVRPDRRTHELRPSGQSRGAPATRWPLPRFPVAGPRPTPSTSTTSGVGGTTTSRSAMRATCWSTRVVPARRPSTSRSWWTRCGSAVSACLC